jgi:hypothetical protein
MAWEETYFSHACRSFNTQKSRGNAYFDRRGLLRIKEAVSVLELRYRPETVTHTPDISIKLNLREDLAIYRSGNGRYLSAQIIYYNRQSSGFLQTCLCGKTLITLANKWGQVAQRHKTRRKDLPQSISHYRLLYLSVKKPVSVPTTPSQSKKSTKTRS